MFNINFKSVDEINNVLNGVSQLPYVIAAPLLDSIRNQAQEQLPKQQAEATDSEGSVSSDSAN